MKILIVSLLILTVLVSGCVSEPKSSTDNTIPVGPKLDDLNNETTTEEKTKEPEEPETLTPKEPKVFDDNCLGFLIGGSEETHYIPETGTWARPHAGPFSWGWIETEKGVYNFEEIDKYVKNSQDYVFLLATVWPFADWDQKSCHSTECDAGPEALFYPHGFDHGDTVPAYRCVPCNLEDFKTFMKTLVERYDNDGVDDMPGLERPITHWEIFNEPSMGEDSLIFFLGNEEDYLDILISGYEGVKEACTDCKVLHAGSAGNHEEAAVFWDKMFQLGAGDYFDIGNIHFINYGDEETMNVEEFKELMNKYDIDKPIWVTEGVIDDSSVALSSFKGAIKAGASKIFLGSLIIDTGDGKMEKLPEGFIEDYNNLYSQVPEICNV